MHNQRFFDQVLRLIDANQTQTGLAMLVGGLQIAHQQRESWPQVKAMLRRHPLYETLQADPMNAYSVARPRGYPGDAGLIDILYDQRPPQPPATELGHQLFGLSIAFNAAEAVRQRRAHAEVVLSAALAAGKRICVLACGHFREGDTLKGQDLSGVVLVDQDPLSLKVVRVAHGTTATIIEANVFRYLRSARSSGTQFDLIYTLGLTDYLDHRPMQMLHRLMKHCLAPGGTILLANFLTAHLSAGWMEAVMDWPLICRDESDLAGYAHEIALQPRTWLDSTGTVAWCEMIDASQQ
jgi:extracellular factor (EF) 3-hydroxypalmitic acid methyl ester biosynthesis protein